jgi:hypothetical protein
MSLPSPAKRGAGRHGGLGGGGAKRSLDGGGYEGRLGVLPFGARCPRRPIGLQKVASLAYSLFEGVHFINAFCIVIVLLNAAALGNRGACDGLFKTTETETET